MHLGSPSTGRLAVSYSLCRRVVASRKDDSQQLTCFSFQYAANLLEELCARLQRIDHDEEHIRAYRNLDKVREFAILKLSGFEKKLKMKQKTKHEEFEF